MKKKFLISLLALFTVVISCTDKSLDPLKFDEIKKGTILALRGTQLDNLYTKGIPGAEVFPKIATGAETFAFDAEYLAEDVSTLESVDYFVLKQTSATTTERVHIANIPFSQFKTDDTYPRPWVSISFAFPDILALLALDNTFTHGDNGKSLSDETITELLTTYQFGVNIEGDLNLTDGTKVTAAEIVASGLFQSNQFYPAMRLNWAMTDYCAYDKDSWGLTYASQESGACCNSLEDNKFTQDLTTDPTGNTYVMDNWWGDAVNATIVFSKSSDPSTQICTVPKQTTSEGGVAQGVGTYNQCLNTMTINCTYTFGATIYAWVYVLTPK